MDEKQLMKDFCLVSGLDQQQAEGWKPQVLGCWEELCRRLRPAVQPQEHRERLSLACAALAHYRLQRVQGEVYSGIKVGDISLTAGSGQQSEATVLEMVGDLLDSAGVCVQGVDVCSRNRCSLLPSSAADALWNFCRQKEVWF